MAYSFKHAHRQALATLTVHLDFLLEKERNTETYKQTYLSERKIESCKQNSFVSCYFDVVYIETWQRSMNFVLLL